MRYLTGLVIAALGAGCGSGRSPAGPDATAGDAAPPDAVADPCVALAAQAQALLEDEHVAAGFPGMAFAVHTQACGIVRAVAGYGVLDPPDPMASDRIATVSSIAKTFVAIVVLQLVDEGRLSLDDPLATWRPEFPQADAITVRQLLAHRSGVRDHWFTPYCGFLENPTPDELITCAAVGSPQFPPGSRFHYSNTNYVILGVIVEEITGHALHDEVRARVIDPLQLLDTYFLGDDVPLDRLMHTYSGTEDITGQEDPAWNWACADVMSDADDLMQLLRALFGGELLAPSSLDEMTTFGPTDGFPPGRYGLGLMARTLEDDTEIWGNAGRGDAMSEAFFVPALGATAVLFVNHRYTDDNIFLPSQQLDRMLAALAPQL